MPTPQEPVLVMNGDILTKVNFRALYAFHQEQKADLTIAVRRYEMQVPYGVLQCEGVRVQQLQELASSQLPGERWDISARTKCLSVYSPEYEF